ncbi:MAG: hypothetical protein IIX45_10480 [Lachnospiraceae bacterium]|nr:hypothetical protein [Lachnospiraceae bacterium]
MNISKINLKKRVNNLKRAGVIFFSTFFVICLVYASSALASQQRKTKY